MESENKERNRLRTYNPSLSFYHPKKEGNGAVLKLELYPATTEQGDGYVMFIMANQNGVSGQNGQQFPSFDYEKRLCFKVNFFDLAKIMQVLRGECEEIVDGGLVHKSQYAMQTMTLKHLVYESRFGYGLTIRRKDAATGEERVSKIFLNPHEALGLSEALSGVFTALAFGNISLYK